MTPSTKLSLACHEISPPWSAQITLVVGVILTTSEMHCKAVFVKKNIGSQSMTLEQSFFPSLITGTCPCWHSISENIQPSRLKGIFSVQPSSIFIPYLASVFYMFSPLLHQKPDLHRDSSYSRILLLDPHTARALVLVWGVHACYWSYDVIWRSSQWACQDWNLHSISNHMKLSEPL